MTTFSRASVSNLVPSWESEHAEGPVDEPLGTSIVEQAVAAHVMEDAAVKPTRLVRGPLVVEQALPMEQSMPVEEAVPVERAIPVAQASQPAQPAPMHARRISPPANYDVGDVTDPVPISSSFAYDVLSTEPEPVVAPLEPMTVEDVEALSTRMLAREALRGRILAFAQQRERRSAYEIAFILLAAAVAALLAAPPLVRVLLAARGIEA